MRQQVLHTSKISYCIEVAGEALISLNITLQTRNLSSLKAQQTSIMSHVEVEDTTIRQQMICMAHPCDQQGTSGIAT